MGGLVNLSNTKTSIRLLDMYLDPQNGKESMFNDAVRLLHNHMESSDPFQVLETQDSKPVKGKEKIIAK
ncbi:hypothetical protein QJS10_CPA16g00434 [Acorus calamus]|uniref:Uncharacterized protein n=1 Tax=Acorus calamus TaxID=4465 RepID=A0AAV9D168_ACOCL|nr:hypothetical protein QJS10_CPA16g00434 [Acorus calamus]